MKKNVSPSSSDSLEDRINSGVPTPSVFFSGALRRKLLDLCTEDKDVKGGDSHWSAEDVVAIILSEASWAIDEVKEARDALANEDVVAEHEGLLKSVEISLEKLKNISSDYDRLLVAGTDPAGTAHELALLLDNLRESDQVIRNLPEKPKVGTDMNVIAIELTIRVLTILKSYGIKPSTTCDTSLGYVSKAIKILKAVGDEVGLVYSLHTWKDKIVAAKKSNPDLKKN